LLGMAEALAKAPTRPKRSCCLCGIAARRKGCGARVTSLSIRRAAESDRRADQHRHDRRSKKEGDTNRATAISPDRMPFI
jgi:hypothetical protein